MTLTKEDVKKIIEMCGYDGHSILKIEALAGVNPEFVDMVTRNYESNFDDPKSTIFTDAGPVKDMRGIYTLDALDTACRVLNLENDAGTYYGRGRMAASYTDALKKWLEQ